jgi:PIN domain nuclease of toxin-antitoxin system
VRLLLDTHALLWWLNDDEELGNLREVLSAILRTTSSSALSPREITVKLRIGNHDADIEEILAILPGRGFNRLTI